jgi:hypothetical protein
MRDLRTLRSICAERLDGIAVPQPFDLDEFAAAMAQHRRRPLEIRALPEPARGLVSGAWVATERADVIYFEPDADLWHRNLIGGHEFGHMVCDHEADATWDYDQVARMLPDISPETIQRMLGRHGYTSEEERDAEMVASLILDRADTGPPPAIGRRDALLPRLTEALQHPVRHV